MSDLRDVTVRRCTVENFNAPASDADFIGLTLDDNNCDRCSSGSDRPMAVVKCDGNLYITVVHLSRVKFSGPAPYGF